MRAAEDTVFCLQRQMEQTGRTSTVFAEVTESQRARKKLLRESTLLPLN